MRVVIGVGNEYRRDDGFGPAVLARLHGAAPPDVLLVRSDAEPSGLIEAWAGADLAVVIDAILASSAGVGRTHRIEVGAGAPARTVSSHGLGVADAIGLARALDLMPARLVVHAVEAADFGHGIGLSAPVAAATQTVAVAVLADLGA